MRTSLLNFKKKLTALLADCPKAIDMINGSKVLSDDITRVMDTYANCAL